MFNNLSSLFGRRASPPVNESSTSQAKKPKDGLFPDVIDSIRDLKCFLADGKLQVALFGSPSQFPDGWLVNLPWNQVFLSYPYELPLDQSLSLQEAQTFAPFLEGLCNDPQTSEQSLPNQVKEVNLNFKDIISSVSVSDGIPAGQVRKVSLALLEKMGEALDNGERIVFPGYVLNPRTLVAKDADGDKPARPERKFGVFRRRTVKEDNQEFIAWTGDV